MLRLILGEVVTSDYRNFTRLSLNAKLSATELCFDITGDNVTFFPSMCAPVSGSLIAKLIS